MDPITKTLFHKYTVNACNSLYTNQNRRRSFSTIRRKTEKKNNRELNKWSLNSNLNVSDENLHRSLFSASDKNRVKMFEQFATIVKELSVGKQSAIWTENTVMKILFTGATSFNRKFVQQMK